MTTIPDDMVERVARAILKARYYDCEPGMYGNDVDAFFAGIDSDLVRAAEYEARAAIEAMQPAILAERERCVAEIASLREQLAESDRNAEKLEALLDPHVSWEGKPPTAILAAEKRGEERERLRSIFNKAAENERDGNDTTWASLAAAIRKGSD